jgi:hypothetical protein
MQVARLAADEERPRRVLAIDHRLHRRAQRRSAIAGESVGAAAAHRDTGDEARCQFHVEAGHDTGQRRLKTRRSRRGDLRPLAEAGEPCRRTERARHRIGRTIRQAGAGLTAGRGNVLRAALHRAARAQSLRHLIGEAVEALARR